jgi:HEAT repeat protein
MTMTNRPEELISELLVDPAAFCRRGDTNKLLEHYFGGFDLETLRPLLSHNNSYVRRSAMFVVAELGHRAYPLLEAVLPLVDDAEGHTAWEAMETIFLTATGACTKHFATVVRQLENKDSALRVLAMRLAALADVVQIEGAIGQVKNLELNRDLHLKGLGVLVLREQVGPQVIQEMLDDESLLTQRYGAIAAARVRVTFPDILESAGHHRNSDIKRFVAEKRYE